MTKNKMVKDGKEVDVETVAKYLKKTQMDAVLSIIIWGAVIVLFDQISRGFCTDQGIDPLWRWLVTLPVSVLFYGFMSRR